MSQYTFDGVKVIMEMYFGWVGVYVALVSVYTPVRVNVDSSGADG